MDDSPQPRLRPDKLAVTVTTIKSQRDNAYAGSSSPSSSEERLTLVRDEQGGQGEMGLGIHRTMEVTQTTSATNESEGTVAKEHV